MEQLHEFVCDRDKAFTNFVLNDDWNEVVAYARKWGVNPQTDLEHPEDWMKAGIYKAVQECTNIPKTVKKIAWVKCLELGFKPTMF